MLQPNEYLSVVDNDNIVLDSKKQLLTSQAQFMSSQHAHQLALDYQLVIRLAACRLDHVTHQWRRFATIRPVKTVCVFKLQLFFLKVTTLDNLQMSL